MIRDYLISLNKKLLVTDGDLKSLAKLDLADLRLSLAIVFYTQD